jgi:transposase InsO family protein
MKYDFMRSHASEFSLTGMCRVLSVSRSGYYGWRRRGPSTRQCEDVALAAHVRRVHITSREAYGARKVWKALVAEGIACGRHRIARVRRENGIEARRRRRFKVTHYARRHKNTAPDRVRRRFHAERPNQCWLGDVTFISTRQG